jgi:hypothetical protein
MPDWKRNVDTIEHNIGAVYDEATKIANHYLDSDEGMIELIHMGQIVAMNLYSIGFTFKDGIPSFSPS